MYMNNMSSINSYNLTTSIQFVGKFFLWMLSPGSFRLLIHSSYPLYAYIKQQGFLFCLKKSCKLETYISTMCIMNVHLGIKCKDICLPWQQEVHHTWTLRWWHKWSQPQVSYHASLTQPPTWPAPSQHRRCWSQSIVQASSSALITHISYVS